MSRQSQVNNWDSKPSLNFQDKIEASSCGKAIIVGEHAVIYGAEAVAIPVHSMKMKISLSKNTKSNKHSLKLGNHKVPDHILGVIDDAFKVLDQPSVPLQIDGTSEVLIGSGLGSSAALSIVILRALAKFCNICISEIELAKFGQILEQRFHGKSSGLDPSVVAYEKVLAFKKGREAQIMSITPPKGGTCWNFVLIDSLVRSSTFAMVNQAAPFFLHKEKGESRMTQFGELANRVKQGLSSGTFDFVSSAMNEASSLLEEAGLVSTHLKEVLQTLTSIGIPAGKLTGAGGGGCLLGLLSPRDSSAQLLELNKIFGNKRVFSVNIS